MAFLLQAAFSVLPAWGARAQSSQTLKVGRGERSRPGTGTSVSKTGSPLRISPEQVLIWPK
jgi:hypothetical protein